MNEPQTLPVNYFDDVYTRNQDPWDYEQSAYEKEKYAETIGSLTKPVYQNAFEIGCSIGVLTEMLVPKCIQLLSVDISDIPISKARERLKSYTNVRVEKMKVPDEFPDKSFDLIILSEVGYYWSAEDLSKAQQLIIDHLASGGQLLLVHWTPFVPDYPLTGDQVHESFLKLPLTHVYANRADKYRLDLLSK
jgi:SAM-dependent methyltransferase